MQESGQPVTVVTFVPRNHQVNSKTPLVVLLHDPRQKENFQVISFASSCAPSWRVVSLSRIFQRESSTCMNPATALCNTGRNNCLIDGHRQHLRETLPTITENFLPHTYYVEGTCCTKPPTDMQILPCGSTPAPKRWCRQARGVSLGHRARGCPTSPSPGQQPYHQTTITCCKRNCFISFYLP